MPLTLKPFGWHDMFAGHRVWLYAVVAPTTAVHAFGHGAGGAPAAAAAASSRRAVASGVVMARSAE